MSIHGNDGFDTILSNGGAANEDIIHFTGTFYDFDWTAEGNDLLVNIVADDTYQWAASIYGLRITDSFTTATPSTISKATSDLTTNIYNPDDSFDGTYLFQRGQR